MWPENFWSRIYKEHVYGLALASPMSLAIRISNTLVLYRLFGNLFFEKGDILQDHRQIQPVG